MFEYAELLIYAWCNNRLFDAYVRYFQWFIEYRYDHPYQIRKHRNHWEKFDYTVLFLVHDSGYQTIENPSKIAWNYLNLPDRQTIGKPKAQTTTCKEKIISAPSIKLSQIVKSAIPWRVSLTPWNFDNRSIAPDIA